MSRALARELGSRNITVNCVAPGFIDTDMTRALDEKQREAMLAGIPLGRLGRRRTLPRRLPSWLRLARPTSPARRSTSMAACSWADGRFAGAGAGRWQSLVSCGHFVRMARFFLFEPCEGTH
jgi:NAD(P)-dependent dehydrogenase (short-subunit alcohol dehydrogenase family)